MDRTESGFSLVELLLAIAIAALALTVFLDAIILTERVGGEHSLQTQARLRVGECLEAARWIRDADGFTALANGVYGLSVSTGRWRLSGTSDTSGGLTRRLTVESFASNTASVSCAVTWEDSASRSMQATTLIAR